MPFQLSHKETFTNQLLDVPPKFWPQIMEKAETLRVDPRPDGDHRKKLHQYKDNIYRIRSGDYRIIYTFGDGWVELLGVKHRSRVYDDEYEPSGEVTVVPGGPDEVELAEAGPLLGGQKEPRPEPAEYLPTKIDEDLLRRLRIPDTYVPALLECRTIEDLLAADVPETVRTRVFDVVSDIDPERALRGATYVTGETHDLVRYVEGELLGFLLKLDEEQEALVVWGMKGTGPTLVKGGPGTGKSTIALYRVQAILRALQAEAFRKPRVLFTTYTNALVAFSQQLLERLLGEDARHVEVRTADQVVSGVLRSLGMGPASPTITSCSTSYAKPPPRRICSTAAAATPGSWGSSGSVSSTSWRRSARSSSLVRSPPSISICGRHAPVGGFRSPRSSARRSGRSVRPWMTASTNAVWTTGSASAATRRILSARVPARRSTTASS